MPKSDQRDSNQWQAEREGYLPVSATGRGHTVYSQKSVRNSEQGKLLTIQREEGLGSLVAAGGMIWTLYVATQDYASLWRFDLMSPSPLEVCALGILFWLHAKWRRSLK